MAPRHLLKHERLPQENAIRVSDTTTNATTPTPPPPIAKSAKVLIVEDESNLRLVLGKELERLGYAVQSVSDGEAALRLLEEGAVDVLLSDINMPGMNGIELLRRVRERPNPPEIIMLTGYATVETAVEAMKLGAYDYLSKPYRIGELDALVRGAIEKRSLRVENGRLRAQLARVSATPEMVAVSASMREALRLVERVAPSDASVLIAGESGTGKELIAQAIHRFSRRAENSFIDVNCAAIQDTLIESELFGYEAGAFSGAKGRKLGLFELADGGTIFLDEVTELPAALQSKLLRAIETRTFYRVGGVRKVQVDVRIIAATNRDLNRVVEDKTFRDDLLYRINGFQITLPALRERPEDIEPLTRHLLRLLGAENFTLTDDALAALKAYSFPGNVRQLRNCLERAVLLSNNNRITRDDLPPEIARPASAASTNFGAPNLNSYASQGAPADENGSADNVPPPLREMERQQILSALERTNWHRGKTAEILGISPSTLYRRLRDYDLERRPL